MYHLSKSRPLQFEGGVSLFRLSAVIFSSHRRSSISNAFLLAWSHDAFVSKHRKKQKHQEKRTNTRTMKHSNQDDLKLINVDRVVTIAKPFHFEAMLYIFEDSEAVIKMIIEGRSPTMRHVSRTDRVALDWLFGRINLDPKIQIKYVDTTNQLADLLTKGNFTGDEWNHLLRLFDIMSFSVFSCSQLQSINKSKIMSKRP